MPVCVIYLICIVTVMAVTVVKITVLDLSKNKAPSQTNDAPGFPEPPMQIYDFTYALL